MYKYIYLYICISQISVARRASIACLNGQMDAILLSTLRYIYICMCTCVFVWVYISCVFMRVHMCMGRLMLFFSTLWGIYLFVYVYVCIRMSTSCMCICAFTYVDGQMNSTPLFNLWHISIFVCVRVYMYEYICYVYLCVYICEWSDGRHFFSTLKYICICFYVRVYIYEWIFYVYLCVNIYEWADRPHFSLHLDVYTYLCSCTCLHVWVNILCVFVCLHMWNGRWTPLFSLPCGIYAFVEVYVCVCMSMYNGCVCVSTCVDGQMDATLLSTLWCECTYVRARVCIHVCVYICMCVCVHMYTKSGWWVVVAHSARRRSFHVKKSSNSKNCTCAHTRVIGMGISVGVCECVFCVCEWVYCVCVW